MICSYFGISFFEFAKSVYLQILYSKGIYIYIYTRMYMYMYTYVHVKKQTNYRETDYEI